MRSNEPSAHDNHLLFSFFSFYQCNLATMLRIHACQRVYHICAHTRRKYENTDSQRDMKVYHVPIRHEYVLCFARHKVLIQTYEQGNLVVS